MTSNFGLFLTVKSEWTVLLFLAPMLVTLFGGTTLLLGRRKSLDKKNLALLLLVVSACMLAYFISDYLIYSPPYGIFRFFDSLSGLIITPLIYFYFASLIQPQKKHGKKLLFWFLPAIILFPLYVLLLLLGMEQPEVYSWHDFFATLRHPEPLIRLITLLIFTTEIIYCNILVFCMRHNYTSNLVNTQSSVNQIDLEWIIYTIILLVLFGVASILGIVLPDLLYKLLFSLFSVVSMFLVFIFGYIQTDISTIAVFNEKSTTANSHVTLLKNETLLGKIDALMLDKKLYLNDNLMVQDIADALCTNRSYVSKAINKQNINFYDYVNTFRVKHAIQLLENYDGRSKFTDIAKRCGFKSYHVFSRLFLEATGCLPREFVKRRSDS